MHWMISPHSLVALATLTALEIVLGVDNIILSLFLRADSPDKSKRVVELWVLD